MKYVLIETRDGDSFSKEFNNANDAIKAGELDFSRLTDHDKKHHTEFFVLGRICYRAGAGS